MRREVTRESRPNQVEARVGCRVQRRSKEQDCLTMVGTRLAAVRLQVKRESRPNRVEARVGLLAQSCWMQLLTRVIQGVNLSNLNFWAFQATMSQSAFLNVHKSTPILVKIKASYLYHSEHKRVPVA